MRFSQDIDLRKVPDASIRLEGIQGIRRIAYIPEVTEYVKNSKKPIKIKDVSLTQRDVDYDFEVESVISFLRGKGYLEMKEIRKVLIFALNRLREQ